MAKWFIEKANSISSSRVGSLGLDDAEYAAQDAYKDQE